MAKEKGMISKVTCYCRPIARFSTGNLITLPVLAITVGNLTSTDVEQFFPSDTMTDSELYKKEKFEMIYSNFSII